MQKTIFNRPLKELVILSPLQAKSLADDLGLHTYGDMLSLYPYRYQDKSQTYAIASLRSATHPVQAKGIISQIRRVTKNRKQFLTATLTDSSGTVQLLWFNQLEWIQRTLKQGATYYVFGLPRQYQSRLTISHPELTQATPTIKLQKGIFPLYTTTNQLVRKGIDSEKIKQIQEQILNKVAPYIQETLPLSLMKKYELIPRKQALIYVHFAPTKAF